MKWDRSGISISTVPLRARETTPHLAMVWDPALHVPGKKVVIVRMGDVDPDILAKLGLSTENVEEKWSTKATEEQVDKNTDILNQLGLTSVDLDVGGEAWEKKADTHTAETAEGGVDSKLLSQLGLDASALTSHEKWEKKADSESS